MPHSGEQEYIIRNNFGPCNVEKVNMTKFYIVSNFFVFLNSSILQLNSVTHISL